MNNNKLELIKVNKRSKEIRKDISQEIFNDSNVINSVIRRKLISHNTIKTLNSEISKKIKDNIALDIFNNNGNTLCSLLLKNTYNTSITEDNLVSKNEKMRTIESSSGSHRHYTSTLNRIINVGEKIEDNIENNNFEKSKTNENTIENNKNRVKYKYYSPFLIKNNKNNEKEKKIKEVIINYKKDKSYEKNEFTNEINEEIKTIDLNKYQNKNKKIKNNKNRNIISRNEGGKIYKRKTVSNMNINNYYYNTNNYKSQEIINKIIYRNNFEKENNDLKNKMLLNNYRKRLIKQFFSKFKPYYYSYLKKYFHIFISNLKNFKKKKVINISKSNEFIKNNGIKKISKDLKVIHLSYSNFNNIDIRYNNTENLNSNNFISSNNSRNNKGNKNLSNQNKKSNYFLINHSNIYFKTIENSTNDKELYRNNFELEKKHSQILQRKKRKKYSRNDNYTLMNSNPNTKVESKTIDVSSPYNKFVYKKNNFEKEKIKFSGSPYMTEDMTSYNSLSNRELSKDTIKVFKSNNTNIKTIPRKQNEKNTKINKNILKKKLNEKISNSINSKYLKTEALDRNKKIHFKYIFTTIPNKKISIEKKREEIDNINSSRYNKNFISKKIKDIFTKDKKINIHIKYVFFIPSDNEKKNLKQINKSLKIDKKYSFSYFGIQTKKKRIIYTKKKYNKLSSIKEEEERSKCSFSTVLQNSKSIEENNSILEYLIKEINNYIYTKMKIKLLYRLKVINLVICLKNVIKKRIFNKINLIKKDEEEKGENDLFETNQKSIDKNGIFLVDDKIIMNVKDMNE